MKIEFDKIYNKWVVWIQNKNLKIEKFKADTKKECVEYIDKNKKKSNLK